jgi:hypothetical protein
MKVVALSIALWSWLGLARAQTEIELDDTETGSLRTRSFTQATEEQRETCDFFQEGRGFRRFQDNPNLQRLQFRYQFNENTGECQFNGLELKVESWQQSVLENLLEGLSVYYAQRFSPDFWEIAGWIQEDQPQNYIQVYRNEGFSFSITADPEQARPGVLLQFSTKDDEFLPPPELLPASE